MSRSIVWFRNDLRLHDNESLYYAAKAGEVLPVYFLDPRIFGKTSFGFPKTGPYRTSFLLRSVEKLRDNLRNTGSDLLIVRGRPEDHIQELANRYDIDRLYFQGEYTREELDAESAVQNHFGGEVHRSYGSTLYHPEDIPFSNPEDVPDVFTSFRKKTEKKAEVRSEYPVPEQIKGIRLTKEDEDNNGLPDVSDLNVEAREISEKSVLLFRGGEDEALKRIQTYFWDQDRLHKYKYTRNGLLGSDYSSKFSPWLANGSLSPRRIFWEVKKYEEERRSNVSTYWMIFELIWRDYFKYSARKYGDRIFYKGGIQGNERNWTGSRQDFERWAEGRTGIPFIDANMRELNETGYMSNRGRQNVASFLAQNLNVDWRMGAEYFESLLLDYDPCSNYGNWAYNTTVGHDPRNRYFNIVSQAEKYDKKGEYIRHWLSELSDVPGEFIHEPHKMSPEQQELHNAVIGSDYPEPMINLEESYEEIKRRD